MTRGGGDSGEGELHPEISTTAVMQTIRIPGTVQTAIVFLVIFHHPFFTNSYERPGSGGFIQKIEPGILRHDDGDYPDKSSGLAEDKRMLCSLWI